MKTIPVGTRVSPELHDALLKEMGRRGQDKAQLLRTFIRDGLARYDSTSEQILHTQTAILEDLKKVQEMVGAVLHLDVEQTVLALRQLPAESPDAYKERLTGEYRKLVFEALGKGARIAAALPPASTPTSTNVAVRHDR
jgi:hypothetical protein